MRATPPGQFPRERYEALRNTTGSAGAEAWLDAPLFACHKAKEGEEFACAGWLAAVGMDNLHVRLLVAEGRIAPEALRPGADWPDLHADYDEMADAKAP